MSNSATTATTASTSTTISTADEMTKRILDASLERVIAVLPGAVDQSMRTAIPKMYTPELAAEFAETMIAELCKPPAPLTGAERGTEWMLRWNCTPWCINDHTDSAAPEFHSAGPVATKLRTTDLGTGGDDQPWLTAETVVMNDKQQAYGRETRVLLGYGVQLAELTPARTRQVLEALRGFAAELEAVCDQADEIAEDDFEGDPEIAAAHEEAEARRIQRITGAAA
ncbi:DUF6907 domain-containing protein [Streptomyces sp. SAS_272]|uniref:DUF6907 domain-containing protein n=1 Tax=Streptomyces sp. SAS_272 TaxID=3412747 RepID=UPI00403C1E8F